MELDSTTQRRSALELPVAARWVMAACAVAAPVTALAGFLLDPGTVDMGTREMVEHVGQRLDGYAAQAWLGALGAFLWVPALLTLGRVARAKAPVLGLIGFVLAFGLAVGSGGLDPYELAYTGLTAGLDVDTIVQLIDASGQVPTAALGFAYLLGLVGLVLLGVAVLRRRSPPPWVGVTLIAAPLAMLALPFAGSAIIGAVPWVLLTAALAGCARQLVKPAAT